MDELVLSDGCLDVKDSLHDKEKGYFICGADSCNRRKMGLWWWYERLVGCVLFQLPKEAER